MAANSRITNSKRVFKKEEVKNLFDCSKILVKIAQSHGNTRITNFRQILLFMASHIENCSIGYENELNECQKIIEKQRNDNQSLCSPTSSASASCMSLHNKLRNSELLVSTYRKTLIETKKECKVLKNELSIMKNYHNNIKKEMDNFLVAINGKLNIEHINQPKRKPIIQVVNKKQDKINANHLCIVKTSCAEIKDMNQALNILTEKIDHKTLAMNKISILNKIKTRNKILINCGSKESSQKLNKLVNDSNCGLLSTNPSKHSPRMIIFGIDSTLSKSDFTDCLINQNDKFRLMIENQNENQKIKLDKLKRKN